MISNFAYLTWWKTRK